MPDPRWRKLLRDLWLHRSRSLVVVLAITTGLAGAGIVLDAWALVDVATREGFAASNPAAATLRTDSIDADLLARVRRVPGVAEVQARRTIFARAQVQGGWRTAMLFVHEDAAAARIGVLRSEVGQWPPSDSAFVIERSSLEFSGASIGAAVVLAIGDGRPVSLSVTGIARDVGLAPGWMEHVVYGFVTPATAARLGASAAPDELQLTVADKSLDRDAIRRIAWSVKQVVEGTGRTVREVEVPVPGEHVHQGQMDSLLFTQGAFGALALLLSGFLVVNLLSAMLAGQVREIGIMKTLGARTGQLVAMYVVLALILGALATGVAVPLAWTLGARYAVLKAELLNFDLAGVSLPPWVVAVQVGAGLLLPLAAAAIPVSRGCRISVGAALRDTGITDTDAAVGGLLLRVSGMTRPVLLSLRNAFRRRQRMVLTLLTLAAGGSVFLGARNLKAAVRDSVDLRFAPMRYDLQVRFGQRAEPARLEAAVSSTKGVSGAEAWGTARATVLHQDGAAGNAFAITALPPGSGFFEATPERGRWLAPDDQAAIVVNRALVRDEPTAVPGSEVRLAIDGRSTTWTVVGVVDGVPTPMAFVPRETLARVREDAEVDAVVVRLTESSETERALAIAGMRGELAAAGFPVAGSQLLEESRRVTEDHLLMVADFLGAMAWLMIVVGGLGLASTMSLSVLERTREVGVLRAIGARNGAILTMVQVEGLVIAAMSWAIALPLSVPMSLVLGRAFGRVMMPVPDRLVPESTGVLAWLALVLVVSLVACALPAVRALRITAAKALAYE